jgi:hypothetical protein
MCTSNYSWVKVGPWSLAPIHRSLVMWLGHMAATHTPFTYTMVRILIFIPRLCPLVRGITQSTWANPETLHQLSSRSYVIPYDWANSHISVRGEYTLHSCQTNISVDIWVVACVGGWGPSPSTNLYHVIKPFNLNINAATIG